MTHKLKAKPDALKLFYEPIERQVGHIPVPEAIFEFARDIGGRTLYLNDVVDALTALNCGTVQLKSCHLYLFTKVPASAVVRLMEEDVKNGQKDFGLRVENDKQGRARRKKIDLKDIKKEIEGYKKMGDSPLDVWLRVISFTDHIN
ncbi:MAG: hypothetical protein Q8Q06_00280 [bacterium]|nr:hypothetical protein [bacterium]